MMQLIGTVTAGSGGVANINFTNIPQDGTDLVLLLSLRSSTNNETIRVKFNSSTSSDYFSRELIGDGQGNISSGFFSNVNEFLSTGVVQSGYTANTFGSALIYISNYSASTAKSISADGMLENNAANARHGITAGSRSSTDAITELNLRTSIGTWVQNSTVSLYKITKA